VRKILLSAERLRVQLQLEGLGAGTACSGNPGRTSDNANSGAVPRGRTTPLAADDPLRWYPIGANGRLRPPQPQELQP
jgi:hypothetical protein